MITIHNFARGARGLRVIWLCEEMGLPYRVAVVPVPADEPYRKLNPLGSVPFLEDNGVAINESAAMLLYLAERYGPTPLLPAKDDPALGRTLQMLVFSEASIGAHLNALMQAHFTAPVDQKRNWSVRAAEARVEQALGYVDQMLGAQPYIAGERFTLADIAISTSLGMWRGALGKTLSEGLAAYQGRLSARPAHQRARDAQRR